jgi:glycosyltransferase involved in cell wall biosynthesis
MAASETSGRARVAIVCTGMDRVRRGFEIHARDLFELLRNDTELELILLKGSGVGRIDEKVVFNLHRDSAANRLLCRVVGSRWKYYIEYVSFAVGLLPLLLSRSFDAFYVMEAPLYKFLSRWREFSGARYKLIHPTGGQLGEIPATERDYVHHVTPCYVNLAEQCGFPRENQFLIPHFIHVADVAASRDRAEPERIRSRLGIPTGMAVVLSVGNIDAQVKRMDYVVRECAALNHPVFLLLLGQQDAASRSIRLLATEKLGPQRFAILTVPRQSIYDYYALADVFVLASLREGFGLVFLEALAAGVPVVAHDYDVSRYVLGEQGNLVDLSKPGALTRTLERLLAQPQTEGARRSRIEYVRQHFEAQALKENYRRMFLQVCGVRNVAAPEVQHR